MGKQLPHLPLACFSKIHTSCGSSWKWELGLDCEPNPEGRSGSVLNLNRRFAACVLLL